MNKDSDVQKKVTVFSIVLILVFVCLVFFSYVFVGLDFAKATLVGCLIIAINYFVSQRIIGKVIYLRSVPIYLIIIYLVKFGISASILFIAVVKYELNGFGIMLGISSILITALLSLFFYSESEQQKVENS